MEQYDEELTKRYHQDKHKMMKAIEIANHESRCLQREIHLLLDVLAESYKPEDLLDSADWSDSDLADEDGGGGVFSFKRAKYFLPSSSSEAENEGDEEISEDEMIAELEAEYEALLQSAHMDSATTATGASASSKRSPSKSSSQQQPSKPRRSYKFLPTDESGAIEYPVVLGRGLNRISISSIGKVIDGPSWLDTDASYIYPLGYECKRKYLDFVQDEAAMASLDSTQPALKNAYYYCQITEGPTFKILVRDGHNGTGDNIVFSDEDSSLEVLWDRFVARFPEALIEQVKEDFGKGQAFFGFHHENLNKYLEEQLALIRRDN